MWAELDVPIASLVLEYAAERGGPQTWNAIPRVCKTWQAVWATLLQKRCKRARLSHDMYYFGPITAASLEISPVQMEIANRGDIRGLRCGSNLALYNTEVFAAAPFVEPRFYPGAAANSHCQSVHLLCVDADKNVYGISYRRVCMTPANSPNTQVDITYEFWQGTFADAMCVGNTFVLASMCGLVQSKHKGSTFQVVAQNEQEYGAPPMSVLSNHDPHSRYGALLVFKFPSARTGLTCLLWVVAEDKFRGGIKTVASLNVGIAIHQFTAVAISKSGKHVCVEHFRRNVSTLSIFKVQYGKSVYESIITEVRSIQYNHNASQPCRDMVMTDNIVIVAGPNGECMAWDIHTGDIEWKSRVTKRELHGLAISSVRDKTHVAFRSGVSVSVLELH